MIKLINLLLSFILLTSSLTLCAQDENAEVLKGYISKVPVGTKIKIIVETPIDEETVNVQDEFKARTFEDVTVNGEVVIPARSTVTGTISEVNFAKKLHRAGSVGIEFKSLTTKDGREVPIVASVLTKSGLIKGKYTKKNIALSTATVVAPAAAGFGAGLAADSSALGGIVGSVVGLVTGIGLFAFQRGNMVDIKAGDEMNIELTEEALVPQEEIEEEQVSKINPRDEESE